MKMRYAIGNEKNKLISDNKQSLVNWKSIHECKRYNRNGNFQDEHPERYGWWINELNSLGVEPKKINGIDDLQELCNITQRLKEQTICNETIVFD